MTQVIELADGSTTVVDDSDYPLVSAYRWHASGWKSRYVATYGRNAGQPNTLYMHRLITQAPPGIEVDHKNGNRRDNRRSNLRLATRSQNEQNKRSTWGRSKYRGVFWDSSKNRWRAEVTLNNRVVWRKRFNSEIEAAEAVSEARRRFFTHSQECGA